MPVERIGDAAQGDLGGGAVVSLADGFIAFVDDAYDVSGRGFTCVYDVAQKDPGMSACDSGCGFAIDSYGGWQG